MRPSHRECDINDVLQKLLDKGLVLNADLIMFVAGVPLLGVNLKAAIAGIETMLEYGMMEAWDRDTREWYEKEYAEKVPAPLAMNEKIIAKAYGSVWSNRGIVNTWTPGLWYLTDKRLFLWRREATEVVFEATLDEIEGFMVQGGTQVETERGGLYFRCTGGDVGRIYALNVEEFKEAIGNVLLVSTSGKLERKMRRKESG